MTRTAITPETRVADLLDAYPQLEEVLIQEAACFKALKNPLLRRTVAKVATLDKAAQMAGVSVRSLVARLRQAAGQPPEEAAGTPGAGGTNPAEQASPPAWFAEDRVRVTLNADSLLAAGEMPLTRIRQALHEGAAGDVICLVSSFRPVPLLDALEGKYPTWVRQEESGRFHLYIACR